MNQSTTRATTTIFNRKTMVNAYQMANRPEENQK